MAITSQFPDITCSSNLGDIILFFFVKFSYWFKFHVNIIPGSGVMTISFYIRDWLEIRKSKIPPSDFWPISGNWGKLRILNLVRTSLIKCYSMLKNSRVTAFIVYELLKENQQGDIFNLPHHPHRLKLKHVRVDIHQILDF